MNTSPHEPVMNTRAHDTAVNIRTHSANAPAQQPTVPPPKQSAATLELRAKPRPVTRLNRKTITAIVGTLLLATLAALLWGLRPPKPQTDNKAKETPKGERVTRPEGLAALPHDYGSIPNPTPDSPPPTVPTLGDPRGDFGQPIGGTHAGAVGNAHARASTNRSTADTADRSATSPVFFKLTQQERAGRLDGAPDANLIATQQGGAMLSQQQALLPGSVSAQYSPTAHNPDSFICASGTVQTPISPRQLMAGTLIRAALITGIRSDLPGQIIATVVENVFDTITGKHLLIPQGSRLLGEYDSNTKYGQERVMVIWNRLIRPDGSSIVLDRLPGVDSSGYSGLEDQVDEHAKRLVSGAALSTLIGVAAEIAAPQRSGADGNIIIAARDSVHDTVNEIGQRITERNLNIKPTLTIRPGYPVQVIVNKDLIL